MTKPRVAIEAVLRLRRALELLAAPAPEQRRWLEVLSAGLLADELALKFEDLVGIVPALVDSGEVAPAAEPFLSQLDAQLALMSGLEEVWDVSALGTSAEWRRVRDLATCALAALNA